jgi:ATP-binding cassette, subfamily C, bacterial LapB
MKQAKVKEDSGDFGLGAVARMPGGMFDLFMGSFFINILSLVMPLTLLQVYDRILPNNAEGTLMLLVMGVGMALVLEALLRIARSYVSGWMGARFEHIAGCAAIERLMGSNIVKFEEQGVGGHLERLNALGTLREYYSGQTILALWDLPFAVLFLLGISYLAGWLVFVPITLITLFGISAIIVGKKLKNSIDLRMLADDRRFNFIIEVLGGVHTVKAMAMEEQMLRRYERLQEGCAEADYGVALHSASAMGVGSLFSQLTLFSVVGFGSTLVIDGMLTVGGLAACTMLAGRSMQPLQKVVGMWTRYQSIRLAKDRVHAIFKVPAEAPAGLPKMPPLRGDIEMRDMTFNFGKNRDGEPLPDILTEVDISIKAGETVGIHGGNASGKTSLLYLMMAALNPSSGQVLIDGLDLADYDPVSIRRQIGYLPQDAVLFNGTIVENLTMFQADREDDALEVARLLGLGNVVAHMPMGYDTVVGDSAGDALPRGIKQRIAITRALVGKPRILSFDEANTAMDGRGDAILRNLLEKLKGRCTMVLVTHRPSVLNLSDRIYDLADARLTPREPEVPQLATPIAEVKQTA